MNVINRSAELVCYDLPELRVSREFEIGMHKDIPEEELEALFQNVGGNFQLKNFLLVEDREWVKKHWDAPIEYFWDFDAVKNCVLNDPLDLFEETLEYAPEGVIELIKEYAWRLPCNDLNKIHAIKEKTGFDAQLAVQAMKPKEATESAPVKQGRLRREEL